MDQLMRGIFAIIIIIFYSKISYMQHYKIPYQAYIVGTIQTSRVWFYSYSAQFKLLQATECMAPAADRRVTLEQSTFIPMHKVMYIM